MLPLDEYTVMMPEPHATLQGVRTPSAIFKNVFCHILFFNAVWSLTNGGFRIVSDTLVVIGRQLSLLINNLVFKSSCFPPCHDASLETYC